MDEMDRMLGRLPHEDPSPELGARIRRTVHRRHRRRQVIRWSGASLLGLMGLWLAWPGIAWLSSGELYASGTPLLQSSLDYLNYGSLEMLDRFWNGTLSAQTAVGSAPVLSIWLGALLLCCAIFLIIDAHAWQPVFPSPARGGGSVALASSIHI